MVSYLYYLPRWVKHAETMVSSQPSNIAYLNISLGLAHCREILVNKTCSLAQAKRIFNHMQQAAAFKDAYGLFYTSLCHKDGFGCSSDDYLAGILSQESASLGCAEAQNFLGIMYYKLGGKFGYAKAFHWFLQAAKQQHPSAKRHVGLLYLHGLGVSQSLPQAINWLQADAKIKLHPKM